MTNTINSKRGGFTLVEIMIVVAIIALLATIAVPSFLRARKRSQATKTLNDARMLEAGKDQYAIEKNQSDTDAVAWSNVAPYIKAETQLYRTGGKDLFAVPFVLTTVGNSVKISTTTYGKFSDVTDSDFWGAYYP